MLDFTKILLPPCYYEHLITHDLLTYELRSIGANGEVIKGKNGNDKTPYYFAEYKDLKFILYTNQNTIIVKGSFHKYHNGGAHNFNDFGILEISETIKEFLQTFKIKPEEARILILEYGLNILPPYETELILNYLYFHKKIPFLRRDTTKDGYYLQVKHDNYWLKVYDKLRQYKDRYLLNDDIIRIELKAKGAYIRKKFNITTLYDLMNFDQRLLLNDLKEQFSISLFYDFTIRHDSKRLLNYKDKNYWSELIRGNRASAYNKHRHQLNQYILFHSDNAIEQINKILQSKFNEIYKGGTLIQPIIDSRKNTPQRKCKITGYDISMQRPESLLLSHAGIQYYKNNHAEVYEHLKYIFLSRVWHLEEEVIQIKEIAHNIRNKYYNNLGKNQNQITLPFMDSTLKRII